MAPSQGSDTIRAELNAWYNALRPLKVDLVGDFAGKELFAIHGEALLLHCLSEARVDFTGMLPRDNLSSPDRYQDLVAVNMLPQTASSCSMPCTRSRASSKS